MNVSLYLPFQRFNVSGPIDLNLTNLTQGYVPIADGQVLHSITHNRPLI
jgi:hypothetical protein